MLWKAKKELGRPSWFIMDENSQMVPFVDSCVYSRNRNIRMFLSCKRGKGQVFVMSQRGNPEWMYSLSSFEQLRYSLISVNRRDSLVCTENLLENPLSLDSSMPEANHHSRLLTTIEYSNETSGEDNMKACILTWLQSASGSNGGRIKGQSSIAENGIYCLYIMGNRFCQRIGRQHKSNNIYFICDTERRRFRQACFDSDCRSFSFPWIEMKNKKDGDDEDWREAWFEDSAWEEIQ